MTQPVGVVLVDDSAIARGMTARALESDPEIRVLGVAGDGQAGLDLVTKLSPDVVLLDIEMPVMDGLDALPRILAARPGAAVIMASALTRRHASMSFRALQLGAADYVPKPDAAAGPSAAPAFFEELKIKVKAHGRRARAPAPRSSAGAPASTQLPLLRPAAIAIGASTGGPQALISVVTKLKGRLRAPIFITQHMPATFTALLAEQLGKVSRVPCVEAQDRTRVQAGAIYVAPGGSHMLAERDGDAVVIRLSDAPPENFCRPAVDPMLRSLAPIYGRGLLAVILTGMGRDGADGCQSVVSLGGSFIVQDEASSVVWGMPAAAYKTGRAMAQLPLEEIGDYVARAGAPA